MIPKVYLGEAQFGNENPPVYSGSELIKGFLPESGIVAIVGDPGAGKSFLALHIASCLATNRRFIDESYSLALGSPSLGLATRKGSVLYLTAEGYDYLQDRIIAQEEYLEEKRYSSKYDMVGRLPIVKMHVHSLSGIDQIPLIRDKVSEKLEQLKEAGFPLSAIIFDTLTSTWSINDENGNSEIQEIVSCLREYGKKFNCLIILIVHPPKSYMSKKGTVRGAGSLEASAEVIWNLEQIGKSSKRRLTITKRRDGEYLWQSFEFDLVPYSNSAVIVPMAIDMDKEAKKEGVKNNKTSRAPKISSIEIEVLQALEAATECRVIEGQVGVERKSILDALLYLRDMGLVAQNSQISDDAFRQRVTRSLAKLSNMQVIQLTTDQDGRENYSPRRPWSEMKEYVHRELHANTYIGIQELRHLKAKELFANIKIPSPSNSANSSSAI